MAFEQAMPGAQNENGKDKKQIEADIDLIRRGASYEITGMPADLADELIAEQRGELYPDLASFIKLNKTIVCPKDEMSEDIAEQLKNAKGIISLRTFYDGYLFVDAEGNVAKFSSDLSQVRSKKDPHYDFQSDLEKIGFRIDNQSYYINFMLRAMEIYQRKVADTQRKEKKDGFNL